MDRWQVIKNGIPVGIFNTIEEAEEEYAKYDCDEIRRVDEDDDYHPDCFGD